MIEPLNYRGFKMTITIEKEDPYLSKKELQYWKEIFSGDSKDE